MREETSKVACQTNPLKGLQGLLLRRSAAEVSARRSAASRLGGGSEPPSVRGFGALGERWFPKDGEVGWGKVADQNGSSEALSGCNSVGLIVRISLDKTWSDHHSSISGMASSADGSRHSLVPHRMGCRIPARYGASFLLNTGKHCFRS